MTGEPWPQTVRPDWLLAPGFAFVGSIAFDLYDAHVVRHHYVDADGGAVRRQLIVQLEAFPAGSGRSYSWRVEHPMRLGGIDHEHGVYAWSVAAFAQVDREAEVAQTARFLEERGYAQGDGQLMSRFARVVGEARQREVIIFYQEDLAHLGLELDEIEDEQGNLRPDKADLAAQITARSLALLRVDRSYADVGREA